MVEDEEIKGPLIGFRITYEDGRTQDLVIKMKDTIKWERSIGVGVGKAAEEGRLEHMLRYAHVCYVRANDPEFQPTKAGFDAWVEDVDSFEPLFGESEAAPLGQPAGQ